MIELKRIVDEATKDWQWFWVDQQTDQSVSEYFASQEEAIDWALAHYDKVNLCMKPTNLWSGREQRVGASDRRTDDSRREEIRFELGKKDRRQSNGRRESDSLGWSSKTVR